MASRIIFVHEGRIRYDGSVDDFTRGGESLEDAFCTITGAAGTGAAGRGSGEPAIPESASE
jgi:hypothetical protein